MPFVPFAGRQEPRVDLLSLSKAGVCGGHLTQIKAGASDAFFVTAIIVRWYIRDQEFRHLKSMKIVSILIVMVGLCANTAFAQNSSYEGVAFSFRLTSTSSDESKTTFHVGEEIVIKPILVNNLLEAFTTLVTDVNYLYRFNLTKAGETLPAGYRSDKAALLSTREERGGGGSEFEPDPMLPGETLELDTMKLSDRFENLTPGNYTLNIRYRTPKQIEINGVRTLLRLTSSVSFQIVP